MKGTIRWLLRAIVTNPMRVVAEPLFELWLISAGHCGPPHGSDNIYWIRCIIRSTPSPLPLLMHVVLPIRSHYAHTFQTHHQFAFSHKLFLAMCPFHGLHNQQQPLPPTATESSVVGESQRRLDRLGCESFDDQLPDSRQRTISICLILRCCVSPIIC